MSLDVFWISFQRRCAPGPNSQNPSAQRQAGTSGSRSAMKISFYGLPDAILLFIFGSCEDGGCVEMNDHHNQKLYKC